MKSDSKVRFTAISRNEHSSIKISSYPYDNGTIRVAGVLQKSTYGMQNVTNHRIKEKTDPAVIPDRALKLL